jgi:hypothetical protein
MRIIGGKDFYDSARAFGEDRDTVFVRNKHSTAKSENFKIHAYSGFPDIIGTGVASWRYGVKPIVDEGKTVWVQKDNLIVVFCGKIYRGIHFKTDDQKNKFFWNYETFINWLYANNGRLRVRWNVRNPEDECREAFSVKEVPSETMDILVENRIAIAIKDTTPGAESHHWFINTDGLKDIGFAVAIDPYTAFQELSMFVGGVLPRSPNPMVELSGEKIMTQKHGFDKWSFRRHKDDP